MANFNIGSFINTYAAIGMMRGKGGFPNNDKEPESNLKTTYILLIFSVIFGLLGYWIIPSYHPQYQKLYYNCKVLDKIQTSAGYKVSSQFILVLQTEEYPVFSLNVSPATYSQAEKGENLTFKLYEEDITGKWSSLWIHLIMCIMEILAPALFIVGIVYYLLETSE